MKKINRNELTELYDQQVEEAKERYENMVFNTEYTDIEGAAGYGEAWLWQKSLNLFLDLFDEFTNQLNRHLNLEEDLLKRTSKDKNIRKTTLENMNLDLDKKDNKDKNKKEIRKIMYDDAVDRAFRSLSVEDLIDLNIHDPNDVKVLWLNAKIEIRNGMQKLFNSIGKLNAIENLINCRNNMS